MSVKFSERVQAIVQYSRGEAVRLGHNYLGSEHLLLGIINSKTGLTGEIFGIFNCNTENMTRMIEGLIFTQGKSEELDNLSLTRRADLVLRRCYEEALAMNNKVADDEHLLLALLRESEGIVIEVLRSFNMSYNSVKTLIQKDNRPPINKPNKKIKRKTTKVPMVENFSRNLTMLAMDGKLDPVIGRHNEIERVTQILTRRKKNNPVLIGEPGVGKTAIIEGLAQRIVNKSVPRLLRNKQILSLDMAALVAGTKYRGQFEDRLKTLMHEIERSPNHILFIDEIHNIVGAGSASGSLDASNMFKPALARGEIHFIGATTMAEYRNSVEKDGALERRFQKIMINSPSTEESIEILYGLKKKYEEHHHVIYSDDAIAACVNLSQRYLNDRFLPDKAIDLMDEAGSRSYLMNAKTPPKIVVLEDTLDDIQRQKDMLVEAQKYEEAAALRDSENELLFKLNQARKEYYEEELKNPLIITREHIANIVAMMTGIPVTKVAESETEKLLQMEDGLHNFIVGQNEAIHSVTKSIQRARVGLKNPYRPIGVFLFLGPTGVGKTELGKVLAQYLFGHTDSLVKIDMSEYGEKFAVSRLVGAPPGYVGYNEGGELTEKIRRNPFSVVLFDEIEKAHPDIFNLLLQVFDEGILTDSNGRKVDFKNTIIIMTSNLGTKEIYSLGSMGFTNEDANQQFKDIKLDILEKVKTEFNPEFMNRIDDITVFHPLSKADVLKIVDLQLTDLRNNLDLLGLSLFVTKRAKQLIANIGFNPEYGARNIRREIQFSMENPISELLLKEKLLRDTRVKVDTLKGEFKITTSNPRVSKEKVQV